MRIVGEVLHPQCKITIFHYNEKYSVKIETTLYEQTYKLRDSGTVSGVEGVKTLVTDEFIAKCLLRFGTMHADWLATQQQIQPTQSSYDEII